MEEITIQWSRSLKGKCPSIIWEKLSTKIIMRFGGWNVGNLYEQMVGLRQSMLIEDYFQQFEYVAKMIPEFLKSVYVGNFVNELKEKIKRKIRVHGP